jgi:hypothetical protein
MSILAQLEYNHKIFDNSPQTNPLFKSNLFHARDG